MSNFTSTNTGIVLSNPTTQNPATLVAGGYVTNITTLHFGDAVYGTNAAAWNFTNLGTIKAIGTASAGVDFRGGGTVTNAVGALIAGVVNGVFIGGGAGTVNNSGTIEGTGAAGAGIFLYVGGNITNASSGLIVGVRNGLAIGTTAGGAGSVTNFGAIEGTGTGGAGIFLVGGGNITNASGGSILGVLNGLQINTTPGTVANFGTIAGTGSAGAGVHLAAGGSVINNQNGLISGVINGAFVGSRYGTVSNFGAIKGTGTAGAGVYLAAGGTVINNQNALLSGYFDGVVVGGVAAASLGVVTNFGTVLGTGVHSDGVRLAAYGYVINQSGGLIRGVLNGVEIDSSFATLSNSGMVAGAAAVNLTAGGSVINNQNGLIIGISTGAAISHYGGMVSNSGTIQGTGTAGVGVDLTAGGYVINSQNALITGVVKGVDIGNATGGYYASYYGNAVYNFGTIRATGTVSSGVLLTAGGTLVNNANAQITGVGFGVAVAQGTGAVVNSGLIEGTGTISAGVYLTSGGRVVNDQAGTIAGSLFGVMVRSFGGGVTNYGNVVATAAGGVGIYLSTGIVTNFGTVTAGTNGIGIDVVGGAIANYGTIIAPSASAVEVRYGVFVNHGLVKGAGSGIVLGGTAGSTGTSTPSGKVTVSGTGTVVGTIGISAASGITAGYTVTVGGTVVGSTGTAVSLGGLTGRLVVDPGAAFAGTVDGGGGASVLEIAALSGGSGGSGPGGGQGGVAYVSLGSVTNFSALQIDPSAMLDGSGALSFNTLINQGQVIVGSGDSLALGTVVAAANTGIIDLRTGGMIDFKGPVAGQTLMFNPAGGTAAIDQAAAFAATVTDFAVADTIDLTHFVVAGKSFANNALMLTDTLGNTATLAIVGSFSTGSFHTTPDGGAGTNITIACYCRGTRILTERGEVPVEDLAIGDKVVTLSGAARLIRWIGRRSYAGRFAFGQRHILPVCITAGALDGGVPRRDLWVSPNHALYLEEVLIEARDLINGISIFQSERVEAIQYFHIELDSHDVILAEGAAAESFIDDDSRGLFHNAHEYRALYPDAAAGPARYCAPRHDQGYAVERARTRIARPAGLAAVAETPPPGPLRGHIDKAGRRRICGWAQDAAHPDAPVCLDILAGGELIGQVVANRQRADLAAAGLGSFRHGFEFELPPGLAATARSIEVRRSLDGVTLIAPHSAAADCSGVGMTCRSA